MEQKDYLLREIEKIGTIIRAIINKIFGGTDNFALKFENQVQETKEMMLNDINFDLEKFIALDFEGTEKYLNSYIGFNVDNIELLAQLISEIGFSHNSRNTKIYLEKALQLYELIQKKHKTYSLERERKAMAIKEVLNL